MSLYIECVNVFLLEMFKFVSNMAGLCVYSICMHSDKCIEFLHTTLTIGRLIPVPPSKCTAPQTFMNESIKLYL